VSEKCDGDEGCRIGKHGVIGKSRKSFFASVEIEQPGQRTKV